MVRGTFSPARAWHPTVGAPLARTLGCAKQAVQYSSRISACRRGLNSHDAAEPRERGCPQERGHAENQTTLPQQPSRGRANTVADRSDMEPPCYIEPVNCVGTSGFRSVRLAAASVHPYTSDRWWRPESAARHCLQLGAGSTCGGSRGVTRPWQAKHQRSPGAAQPNPSFEARPNGKPPGPAWRYAVHFRQSGPGVLPSVPPQLER